MGECRSAVRRGEDEVEEGWSGGWCGTGVVGTGGGLASTSSWSESILSVTRGESAALSSSDPDCSDWD